jgi:hypothetical protein
MLLYLSMISLSSLPVWRDEKLLFIRCLFVAYSDASLRFTPLANDSGPE